ncbi:MAG: TIGR04086 family membrane protein [Clostridiales bacterium]|jgi:putative membrane protein (TIGR04086 family)|nr:TIGR04086 family membrane protein [Clostridiales bacterium]
MSFLEKIGGRKSARQQTTPDDAKKSAALEVVKALAIAIASTLVLILIFALIICLAGIPDGAIMPINQGIKIVSLLLASLLSFKVKKGGWKKGMLLGVIYVAAAFIIFSLIDGAFEFKWSLAIDILLGTVVGIICGIIAVNIRK